MAPKRTKLVPAPGPAASPSGSKKPPSSRCSWPRQHAKNEPRPRRIALYSSNYCCEELRVLQRVEQNFTGSAAFRSCCCCFWILFLAGLRLTRVSITTHQHQQLRGKQQRLKNCVHVTDSPQNRWKRSWNRHPLCRLAAHILPTVGVCFWFSAHLNSRRPLLEVAPRARDFDALPDGGEIVRAQEGEDVVLREPGVRLPQLRWSRPGAQAKRRRIQGSDVSGAQAK